MKISGKFILKVAGTLTAISLVVAALLGFVNSITKDKIAAIDAEKTRIAMSAVTEEGSEFGDKMELSEEAVAAASAQGGSKLMELYPVTKDGAAAGYVMKISASGSQGSIVMMVGVDAAGWESLTNTYSLGVFIPLIVVNCIILGRAEGFASKNGIGASAVDGICQGIGYTLVLIVMCVVREFLGSGKFGGGLLGGGALGSAPGITIIPEEFGIKVLTLPVGGFLTLGCLIALMQWALAKSAKKKEGK